MREGDERGPSARSIGPPWQRRVTDLSRLFALSDGIFAFAMTLLVLSIALPVSPKGDVPGLRSQITNLPFVRAVEAYAIVFVILASYWRAHQLVFQYVRAWDRNLVQFNFLFLALVVTQPFLVTVLSDYTPTLLVVALYGGVSAATGFALYGTWAYASYRHQLLVRGVDAESVRYVSDLLLLTPVIFLASVPVAVFAPNLAEYVWLGVFVLPFVYVRSLTGPGRRFRRAGTLEASSGTDAGVP